jgi:DNA-directed RNA polymerase subunit RPC12/RpoP
VQHICRSCGSGNVDRARTHVFRERVRNVLGWRVYDCRDCGERFEDAPSGHMCPQCLSSNVDRVHRQSVGDHIKGVFGWRVYRCCDCGARFHDLPLARKAS